MGATSMGYWLVWWFRAIVIQMNSTSPSPKISLQDVTDWRKIVARFQKPSAGKATWQIINSLGSYALLWFLMYYTRTISWWLTIPLAILAGAFLVRVFIIFHDCGLGSFFILCL